MSENKNHSENLENEKITASDKNAEKEKTYPAKSPYSIFLSPST